MSAPFFFKRGQGLTVREIAALTGAEPRRGRRPRPAHHRHCVARPRDAARSHVPRKSANMPSRPRRPRAGACLTIERFADRIPHARQPCWWYARPIAPSSRWRGRCFRMRCGLRPCSRRAAPRPGAFVHPTARLESGVSDRSGRGDRTARRDRRRDRDRRRRRHRTRRAHRPRLLDRGRTSRSPIP